MNRHPAYLAAARYRITADDAEALLDALSDEPTTRGNETPAQADERLRRDRERKRARKASR